MLFALVDFWLLGIHVVFLGFDYSFGFSLLAQLVIDFVTFLFDAMPPVAEHVVIVLPVTLQLYNVRL